MRRVERIADDSRPKCDAPLPDSLQLAELILSQVLTSGSVAQPPRNGNSAGNHRISPQRLSAANMRWRSCGVPVGDRIEIRIKDGSAYYCGLELLRAARRSN
jgi:hypothetical protein